MEEKNKYEITFTIKYDIAASDEDAAVEIAIQDILSQLEDGADLLDVADVEILEV